MTAEVGVRLRLDEAAPLLHALLAHVAEELGLRVLAVKGPAVALQGLREPRASADVDVLVRPEDLPRLIDGMVALGWRTQASVTAALMMPTHSVNLLHDHWPVGIDVHHYFPGFLAEPGDVFDALWERQEPVRLAGVMVPAVDPVGQVAIVALHHLRVAPTGTSPALEDLRERAARVLAAEGVQALVELAERTDATAPLRPFFLALGVPHEHLAPARDAAALETWERRVRAERYEAWFVRFAETPKRQWPHLLRHALLLTEGEIYAMYGTGPEHASLARLRLHRIGRGARALPGTVRVLARRRRTSARSAP